MDHAEIQLLQSDMKEMKEKMDKMYFALMGNDIAKDGGLVGRIIELEKDVEVLQKEIDNLKADKTRSDVYIKIMWGLVGAIGTSALGFVLTLIFKH